MPRHRLIKTAVSGTNIVSVFWNNDEGLLKYRGEHPTGYMVSVCRWLHLYQLQDEQGFKKFKPHDTYTKTCPKVCVASRADIPELIGFVLANLAKPPQDQVQWGASGAIEELKAALGQMGMSLNTVLGKNI